MSTYLWSLLYNQTQAHWERYWTEYWCKSRINGQQIGEGHKFYMQNSPASGPYTGPCTDKITDVNYSMNIEFCGKFAYHPGFVSEGQQKPQSQISSTCVHQNALECGND